MKQQMFKTTQQQDAQEFLRCLLTQIHDEIGIQVPQVEDCGCGRGSCDIQQRDSVVSCDSDTSAESLSSQSRLVGSCKNSPLPKKNTGSLSPLSYIKPSTQNSPISQSKSSHKYTMVISTSSIKSSEESIPSQLKNSPHRSRRKISGGTGTTPSSRVRVNIEWGDMDVFEADVVSGNVRIHRNYLKKIDTCSAPVMLNVDESLEGGEQHGPTAEEEEVDPQVSSRDQVVEEVVQRASQEQQQTVPSTCDGQTGSTQHSKSCKLGLG